MPPADVPGGAGERALLQAGDRIGRRYRVLEPVAQGGMAQVFLVEDEPSGTRLICKQLRLGEGELLDAFRAEFALLAGLTHPHLARVHDFGSERVRGALVHYYTAEWIEGTTLRQYARRPGARWHKPLCDALRGLAALHELGVVHGDFTPDNVLVQEAGTGVLIDLGCARAAGERADSFAGTPGFLAPELLETGVADVATDLYAVGASLKLLHELAGTRPSSASAALLARLSAKAARERPTDVHSVLAALGEQSTRDHRLAARTLKLVGRAGECAQFSQWLAALAAGEPRARVLAIGGRRGAGKTRLVHELVARAELRLPVLRAHARDPHAVRWLLQAALGEALGAGARGALAAAQTLSTQSQPSLLVLEDVELLASAELELLRQFARSLEDGAKVGLVLSGLEPLPGIAVERMLLGPLDVPALAEWTGHALSERALGELARHSEGLPARIEAMLAELHTPERKRENEPSAEQAALEHRLSVLAPDERARLALLVALDGELEVPSFGRSLLDYTFASERGLVARERSRLHVSALVSLEEFAHALGAAALAAAHRLVAQGLERGERPELGPAAREAEIVRHELLAGDTARAGERITRGRALWQAEPGPVLQRVARLERPRLPAAAGLVLAELALAAGEPRLALGLAARVLRGRPAPELAAGARLSAGDALTRLGRGARALSPLRRLLEADPSPAQRRAALEALARAHIQCGDYASAESAARAGLDAASDGEPGPGLREALGVAAMYAGELERAGGYFAEALATSGLGARDRCRVLGYRAICAFRAGQPRQACADHALGLELAQSAGLDDLIAVGRLNLGTALQQLGDLGGALKQYQQGLAIARAIGRESTELVLLYNRINIQVEVGDQARVGPDITALERRAEQRKLSHFAPALALVRAEIALLEPAPERARAALEQAARGFDELKLERERLEVELGFAELDLLAGAFEPASARARAVELRARALGAVDLELRAEHAHARLAVRRADASALPRIRAALETAERAEQHLLAAKLAGELALAAEASGAPGLFDYFETARKLWDRLAADLPDALREVFWADPRRARLVRFTRFTAPGRPAGDDAATLRRLLSLSRRINSSLSLERVLAYALEAAVELSGAERGFIVLARADGTLRVEARTAADAPATPSFSIVERVLARGEPLLTTDAEMDARLSGSGSVHAQRLKAVLCVPIATPSATLGALYVDSRLTRTRFTEPVRDVVGALADHVAVALSNARLHRELEQQKQALAAEKRNVERLSAGKDKELGRLRTELEAQRRTLEFRYDYAQIVGRGERMRGLLEALDRVIDADVNVLIQGESGTGKELVARAIHVHGARKAGPFVAVNCASIPEALLESELFGHVRGAFTGAERDKTGLMLSANGGTLFLDELAELSPATQAKLLRALQEREVRPLGAERARAFDVRLVCATHKKLAREVEAERFREDLFYRVAVVELELPPLRERLEDVPELARAILERVAKAAGKPTPELGRDALNALAGYTFPGNVRELENILTRACVLSGRAKLSAKDLDLERALEHARSSRNRREFESEERERILNALRASRWNVSVVSRTLGIPRNTLYRKLERYGLEREEPPQA